MANTRREKREAAEAKKVQRNEVVAREAAKDDARKPLPGKQAAAAAARSNAEGSKLTRRQRTEAAQQKAEELAKQDALLKPQPVEDNVRPGETPPLHILNQRAREEARQANEHAMNIGREVGGVARDLVIGRQPRIQNRGNRHERHARATLEMQRAHEAAQARKAEEEQKS